MRQQSSGETDPPHSSSSVGGVKAGFPPGADILRRWGGGLQVEESWGHEDTYTEVWLLPQTREWVHGELRSLSQGIGLYIHHQVGIKMIVERVLKCRAIFFFFTLYISSSSLYTCHQVDSQCNKNRQLVLNQVLAVWWVGPQN